jgi:hypothetical protein
MNLKSWLVPAGFGLALIINPYLACSSNSDFDYSEGEMKQAVLGNWQGTAVIDGETIPFSLTLEQATASTTKQQGVTAPGVKPQCGSRSFVKPAAACISISTMPLVGTITSENPLLNGPVDGEAEAWKTLDSLSISLQVEGGPQLGGTIEDDAIADGTVGDGDKFSLSRP